MRQIMIMLALLLATPASAQPVESFDAFLAGFRDEAMGLGVRGDVYDATMSGLTPDPRVPGLVATQPEFTTTIWDYIEGRVTSGRIARGQAAMTRNATLFEAIANQYGVDPYLLGAIWGMETDYGAVLDDTGLIQPIIPALATLVHQRRSRLEGDTMDLIAALRMVQNGADPDALVGSWAGAMGHLQVNPSNVLAHGRDGDGDGQIDLHTSLADALATSSQFLLALGYKPGLDWGMEVVVPEGFDYLLATRTRTQPISFFAARGVVRVSGRSFADPEIPVFLYVPAGKDGPKFLMTQNYLALKGYNFSDSYAMSVAHLTDRLKGSGGFTDDWPRDTAFPNLAQRQAIQQSLLALGLYDGAVDGRIGPVTQDAYARFQAARGEVADGFVTRAAYEALAAAVR